MKEIIDLLNPFKWSLYKVFKDIQNYRDWIDTIKKEKLNPKSKWYQFRMKHNYFYTIYFELLLPNEYKDTADEIRRLRIVEVLSPVHRYLDDDLGFAEFIVPEFNQFYDENNEPTLAYGIIYRFAFNRLSLGWIITRLLFITTLVFSIFKYVL